MTNRKTTPKYPTEVRERAVRMVLDHAGEYPSQWAAIESVAAKFGCAAQTLHNWVACQTQFLFEDRDVCCL